MTHKRSQLHRMEERLKHILRGSGGRICQPFGGHHLGAGAHRPVISSVPVAREMLSLWQSGSTDAFQTFLGHAFNLVIGIEFIKMLAKHSPGSALEVLLYAIARNMILGHGTAAENLLGVAAIGLIFVIRKFLFVPSFGATCRAASPPRTWPSVPSDASGRAGKDPGGKRSMTPAPALHPGRGSVSQKRHAPGGTHFCPHTRDRNSFPLVSPLGTKLSAEPRTRRKAARTLSALNFPVCVPSIRTCRLDGTFLTVCPAPHPGRGRRVAKAPRSRGNPFLPAYAGQKFLPPGIPLGTKLSAEPRTSPQSGSHTLSAQFPCMCPVHPHMSAGRDFFDSLPRPSPGAGFLLECPKFDAMFVQIHHRQNMNVLLI